MGAAFDGPFRRVDARRALPKLKTRPPKQYEVAEAMDDICLEFENYGLQQGC